MVEFNIIVSVGTTETPLAPYPGGAAAVPAGKTRKIYAMILSNPAASPATLTINIYRGETLEASTSVALAAYGSIGMASERVPILIVPSGRTPRAVASSGTISVLMTGKDE